MKITQEKRNITSIGGGEQIGFKIAATAHAFDILSSKLYTDTKLAIVRELSTNAYDAQVEAGNPEKPFDVHMPNSMEPYFRIRDYGTGLSRENLEHVYTTFFESTRNSSDDFVGALGLGSKSPFAYTDMFTVTSFFNGMKYVYSAFKGESGEPNIKLMSTTTTTEDNGLEISIEVKSGDSTYFHEAGTKVYRFFDVRPNITGARLEFVSPTPDIQGDGYELFALPTYDVGVNSKISVVMGNVRYAVADNFQSDLGYNSTLIIYTNIGECSIAASREELQYDDVTTENIQSRIDAICIDVRSQINDKLKDCVSTMDKAVKTKTFLSLMSFPHDATHIKCSVKDKYDLKRVRVNNNKLFMGSDRWQSELRPSENSQYIFIENDVADSIKQSHKNNLRHWITTSIHWKDTVYIATIEDAAHFEATFGKAAIKVSDIPAAPKAAKGVTSSGPKTFLKLLKSHDTGRLTDQWLSVDESEPDITDAIAVRRKGFHLIWQNREYDAATVISIAKTLGYAKVYGIADKYFDRITKELGLDDLEVVSKAYIENFVKKLDKYALCRYVNGSIDYRYGDDDAFFKEIKGLSTICDDLIGLNKAVSLTAGEKRMISMHNITMPDSTDIQAEFKKSYPLLAQLDFDYAEISDITEYITLKEQN